MDQNDLFKISKFAIFFVLWLSNWITLGGPQYHETCLNYTSQNISIKYNLYDKKHIKSNIKVIGKENQQYKDDKILSIGLNYL